MNEADKGKTTCTVGGWATAPVDSPVSLHWSSEPPKTPGWYWYKDHHHVARIEQIHAHPDNPDVMTRLDNTYMGWRHTRIQNLGLLWAGPISEPLEAN
jgi:hypothetical protein